MKIVEMKKKYIYIYMEQGIFDFEIIAFELVSLNSHFYWQITLLLGCQYVNTQDQDFIYY